MDDIQVLEEGIEVHRQAVLDCKEMITILFKDPEEKAALDKAGAGMDPPILDSIEFQFEHLISCASTMGQLQYQLIIAKEKTNA